MAYGTSGHEKIIDFTQKRTAKNEQDEAIRYRIFDAFELHMLHFLHSGSGEDFNAMVTSVIGNGEHDHTDNNNQNYVLRLPEATIEGAAVAAALQSLLIDAEEIPLSEPEQTGSQGEPVVYVIANAYGNLPYLVARYEQLENADSSEPVTIYTLTQSKQELVSKHAELPANVVDIRDRSQQNDPSIHIVTRGKGDEEHATEVYFYGVVLKNQPGQVLEFPPPKPQ